MSIEASPRLITIDTGARLLGISKSTAYRMAATGDLPVVRMSHRVVRVALVDVERIIASRLASVPTPLGADADPTNP